MKYLLKKDEQDKGVLCDKVTLDGFDYYVSDDAKISTDNLWVISKRTSYLGKTFYPQNDGTVTDDVIKELLLSVKYEGHYETTVGRGCECDLVISTNNPNIDLPKVMDEAQEQWLYFNKNYNNECPLGKDQFERVYNYLQSTHPNSDEDMIAFSDWQTSLIFTESQLLIDKSTEELLHIWKAQQPKVIYYHD